MFKFEIQSDDDDGAGPELFSTQATELIGQNRISVLIVLAKTFFTSNPLATRCYLTCYLFCFHDPLHVPVVSLSDILEITNGNYHRNDFRMFCLGLSRAEKL